MQDLRPRAEKNPPHRWQPAVDLSVPMVVMDYAFLRDKGEEKTIAIIVARDRQTRVTTAAQVPMKGASEKWSTNVICRFIDKLGTHEDNAHE